MKNTFVLLLVFTTMLASSVCSQESKFGVEIELSKQRFVLHEPIWLDVCITNRTSDTLRTHTLDAPNHRQFSIELRDGAGDPVKYTGPQISIFGGVGKLLLNAGEHESESFNLTELFGALDRFSGYGISIRRFPFMLRGEYTVQVVFEDGVSNVLTFEVVEPTDDNEKVLHLIEEASKIWVQDHTDPSSQKYKQIVERFPQSVFAETCYYLSRFYSQAIWDGLKQGSYDYGNLHREMIDRYPNSGNAKTWLLVLGLSMDDSSKVDLLSRVVKDKPDTRAAKHAALMLRRIANQKAGE